ncbi:MAG: hypothetical protein IPN34_14900 [Planctomycetes bacterium]|nr:hypothetical protein [Planctomycetota bacterium]
MRNGSLGLLSRFRLLFAFWIGALVTSAVLVASQQPPPVAPSTAVELELTIEDPQPVVAEGMIGAEGGTLVVADGSLEVEWAPNPERRPEPARVSSLAGPDGQFEFDLDGPRGPATMRWFPPRPQPSPAPPANVSPDQAPPPPPEPVVTIEEGNGEWREVQPGARAAGGKEIRLTDQKSRLRSKLAVGTLFDLDVGNDHVSLGQTLTIRLRAPAWESRPAPPAGNTPGAVPPPAGTASAGTPPTNPPARGPDLAPSTPAGPTLKLSPQGELRESQRRAEVIARSAVSDAVRQTRRNSARIVRWSVDGIAGGNATVGTLVGNDRTALGGRATYTAPKVMLPSRSCRLAVVVQEGDRQVRYERTVRLLDRGEVMVELRCSLRVVIDIDETKNDVIVVRRRQQTDFRATVSGSFVGFVRETMVDGKPRLAFYNASGPASGGLLMARMEVDQTDNYDEKGPGEFGERGATKTSTAKGADLLGGGGFSLELDPQRRLWSGTLPFEEWMRRLYQVATYRQLETLRPRGGLDKVPEFMPWQVPQLAPLLAALPDTSDHASIDTNLWTGSQRKVFPQPGGAGIFKATWTIRK